MNRRRGWVRIPGSTVLYDGMPVYHGPVCRECAGHAGKVGGAWRAEGCRMGCHRWGRIGAMPGRSAAPEGLDVRS